MKRADPDAKPAAPFSRPYLADSVRDGGDFVKVSATEAECAGLALLLRVVAVRGLSADMKVTRSGRYGVRVTGEVRAHVTQTCVVSLEPFEVACREEIDIRFAPEADSAKAHAKAAAEMTTGWRKVRVPSRPCGSGALERLSSAGELIAPPETM